MTASSGAFQFYSMPALVEAQRDATVPTHYYVHDGKGWSHGIGFCPESDLEFKSKIDKNVTCSQNVRVIHVVVGECRNTDTKAAGKVLLNLGMDCLVTNHVLHKLNKIFLMDPLLFLPNPSCILPVDNTIESRGVFFVPLCIVDLPLTSMQIFLTVERKHLNSTPHHAAFVCDRGCFFNLIERFDALESRACFSMWM